MPSVPGWSDYIVYVDESGDHGLESIDPEYPVFVLLFCICKKTEYAKEITPAISSLKFKHFGHDQIVLHEREIRKAKGPFSFLVNADRRASFFSDLSDLIVASPITLIASVILREKLRSTYTLPDNPYHLALEFGLERVALHLRTLTRGITHVIVECRGKKEDAQLELEFLRVKDGGNALGTSLPLEIVFADKKSNSSGLQLADLLARPIGRHIINPAQPNRAFDTLEPKFRRSPEGKLEGWGLKCFP